MKVRDMTELAVRNLRESMLRNSLTTLGVAVGVASLVAMLSLGVGLQELASKRLSRSGLFDAVFVTTQGNFREFGRSRPRTAAAGDPRVLDDDARGDLAHLPGVTEVYPDVRFATEVRYQGTPYATMVAGVPASALASGAFDGMQGKFFSSADADEAILQIEFAREITPQTETLVGKDLELRYAERQTLPAEPDPAASAGSPPAKKTEKPAGAHGSGSTHTEEQTPASQGDDASSLGGGFSIVPRQKLLRIVGVVDSEPAAGFGGIARGRVFIPLHVAESLRATQANDLRDALRGRTGKPSYLSLTVRVDGPSKVKDVEAAIKQMGFATFSLLDATKNIRLVFAVFDVLLGIFGSLALVVSSLGIINTLVMAILDRRREIGVLKALGAADGDIQKLFFVEAGAMGFLGGVLGVVFGWLIGRALTLALNIYLRKQELPGIDVTSVPWWLAAGAIGFAVLVSLIAGMYPASRAAKLNPVEALRYE
jgi:putative ABC transport system permease protein